MLHDICGCCKRYCLGYLPFFIVVWHTEETDVCAEGDIARALGED